MTPMESKHRFRSFLKGRYAVSASFLASIRERGFEVVVHDLNHDGHLYRDRKQFLRRAARINSYGKQYEAEGFRAAVLYRKQRWFDALKFSYDMSVPNVAHLDPQPGGCCTVMPYFIGDIVRTTCYHDAGLHDVSSCSTTIRSAFGSGRSSSLWKSHGLISFIVHPDYIMKASGESRIRGIACPSG